MRMTFSRKLIAFVILASVSIVGVAGWTLSAMRDQMVDDRKVAVKAQVESAVAVLESLNAEAKAGRIDDATMRAEAAKIVGSIRFGSGDYIFVINSKGEFLVHPKLQGQKGWDLKDANGVAFIREIVGTAKAGGGYTAYDFPRAGSDLPVPKISYAQAFAPWDWIVGTGVYVDDIEATFWGKILSVAAVVLPLILVIAALGLLIARSTSRRLAQSMALARAIGAGNLTNLQISAGSDELGDLQRTMAEMAAKLSEIVAGVRRSSSLVATGSGRSAHTAEQLASGSTAQASASEKASAAVEEMTANVRQNADNAAQTETIAKQAALAAARTGEAVSISVEAMRTIADKITVVQEIARQTDLLALNAAIEAARAGSHGKGFAVVASEVRKLAERSQHAAAEIGELSVRTVSDSENAGAMLEQLVPNIQRTAELVSEISAACREQSVGIEQINEAIQQLDQVTQANAGAANEMTATAEALSAEAGRLEERAAFFRLTDRERAEALAEEAEQIRADNAAPRQRPSAPQPNRSRAAAGRPAPDRSASGFDRLSA